MTERNEAGRIFAGGCRAGGAEGAERPERSQPGSRRRKSFPRSEAKSTHHPVDSTERSERRSPSRSESPNPDWKNKSTVEDQNNRWSTNRTVSRRSGAKTPGFRVTVFLVRDGRFGVVRDGLFGRYIRRTMQIFLSFGHSSETDGFSGKPTKTTVSVQKPSFSLVS